MDKTESNMLKRAKVPDMKFCGCNILLESHHKDVTESDIQEYATMFANIAAETERGRAKTKRHFSRRAKEVLGIV